MTSKGRRFLRRYEYLLYYIAVVVTAALIVGLADRYNWQWNGWPW